MFEFDNNLLRILIAIIMLGIATIMDIKKREIHDGLWIIFGAIAVILILFEPEKEQFLIKLGFSLIVAPFVLIAWRFGLFGGADALGIITLAGLSPMLSFSDTTITPFTILVNSAIISIIPLLYNFIKNCIALANNENIFEGFSETKSKKIIAMFLGHIAKNPRYSFSIERQEGNTKKFDIKLHNAETEEFCNTPNSWVTLGLPYMIFILAGYLIQIFHGDLIFQLINFWN